jgi:hypothetical protein
MELIPMFEENGYKLIENGVGSSYRHLVFEKIE